MPKAHSRDLRLRVIETIEAGGRNATNSAHSTGALVGGRYAIDFRARRMAMVATGGYCATRIRTYTEPWHPEYWGCTIPWIRISDARGHDGGCPCPLRRSPQNGFQVDCGVNFK
jgi:hypothetical protein